MGTLAAVSEAAGHSQSTPVGRTACSARHIRGFHTTTRHSRVRSTGRRSRRNECATVSHSGRPTTTTTSTTVSQKLRRKIKDEAHLHVSTLRDCRRTTLRVTALRRTAAVVVDNYWRVEDSVCVAGPPVVRRAPGAVAARDRRRCLMGMRTVQCALVRLVDRCP